MWYLHASIKTELLKLSEISKSLQTLLENNKLQITLQQKQQALTSKTEQIITLQLDATNIERYTGQAVLRISVLRQELFLALLTLMKLLI